MLTLCLLTIYLLTTFLTLAWLTCPFKGGLARFMGNYEVRPTCPMLPI